MILMLMHVMKLHEGSQGKIWGLTGSNSQYHVWELLDEKHNGVPIGTTKELVRGFAEDFLVATGF